MTYYGYVSPSAFGQFCLPAPFQNQLLRNRANDLNMNFGLGVGEVVLSECFLGLFETLRIAQPGDIIGCCSLELLPRDRRLGLVQKLILDKSLRMDFLFEFTGLQKEVVNLLRDFDWKKTIGRG